MTPEEIVKLIISEIVPDYVDYHYENTEQIAIEAIKAYAREMCDKQKVECAKVGYAMDALYSKELE